MDDTSQYPMLIISFEQQKEAIGNEQRKEKVEEPKYSEREQQGKDGKTYNLEVLVQKQKKKEIYKFRTGSRGELRMEHNVAYAVDGFITNVKELQRKEYLKNTHMKHTTSAKKTINRSN